MKAALCIRGAVSRMLSDSVLQNSIYDLDKQTHVNYQSVAKSINMHIIDANKHIAFDTFIHCWNEELKDELDHLYQPIVSLYENNNLYKHEINFRCKKQTDFSGISQALTIKKVLQLKSYYEYCHNFIYDIVILYRPDVLLWKDMILNNYDIANKIYVNAHPNANGDYHFVMSSNKSQIFEEIYDSTLIGNPYKQHYWIKNYIEKYSKTLIVMDNIVPGRDQEVIRPHKLRSGSIHKYKIDPNLFQKYDINLEYIFNN